METIVVGTSLRDALAWANQNLNGYVHFIQARTLPYALRGRRPGVPIYLLEGWRDGLKEPDVVDEELALFEALGSLLIEVQKDRQWLLRMSEGRCLDCGLDALRCQCCEECGRPECECA